MSSVATSDIAEAEAQEREVEEMFGKEFLSLTKDESEMLSRVLFPDTDTTDIEILGVKRVVRPLPVKWSKQLFHLLRPFSEAFSAALSNKDTEYDATPETTDLLHSCTSVMCDYYGETWKDIQAACAQEELSITELQQLVVAQQEVNGRNDFLLAPLRTCIRVMQVTEIAGLKFQSLFTTPTRLRNGDVRSTILSEDTPKGSSSSSE